MTFQVWCGYQSGGSIPSALLALEADVRNSTCALRVLDGMSAGEAIQAALGRRGISTRVAQGLAVIDGGELLRACRQGLLGGFDEVWLLTSGEPLAPVPDGTVFTSDRSKLSAADATAVGPIVEGVGAWLVLGDGSGLSWATIREQVRDVLSQPLPEPGGSRGWFAIRQLFLWGTTDEGLNVFEERIVCSAGTQDEAYAKAAQEAEEYADFHGFVVHPQMDSYRQDDEPLIDGYEVWSVLYRSRLSLEEFHAEHYLKFAYREPADLRPARPPRDP